MALGYISWDSADLLEQNRQRMLKHIKAQLQEYEARYELSSDRLESELAAGRLRETHDICKWIIDLYTYRSLIRER